MSIATNPQESGIDYLIEVLEGGDDRRQGITRGTFIEALKSGAVLQPQRFEDLVNAFQSRLQRAYSDWSPEQCMSRALENLAGYVTVADHDFASEMVVRAAAGGPKSVQEYLSDPAEYGPATKLLAKYVGVEGPQLSAFVFGKPKAN